MKKGIFIAFEGLDGSGKTTQFNAIKNKLAKIGINCIGEKEPSDRNPIGLLLQDIVRNIGLTVSPISMAKLFSVDRYEHVINNIKPCIDSGGHVLIDRYVFSSFAYQGLDLNFEDIFHYNRDAIELLMPDITIFVDVAPEVCLERINNNRIRKELFDDNGVDLRERFFDAFERMKDTAKVLIVDGNRSADAVTDEIWDVIGPRFMYSERH
ncbi:MAG: dTMP kinase [Defluviitaleaceae bacterium]|nr:dTMP kinase [Defluviitaleaceae bacterium]